MDSKHLVYVSAAIIAALASATYAADVTLANGDDLAAAVAAAEDGDTITLGAGTYSCVSLSVSKPITIRGAGTTTLLDAGASATAVTLGHADAVLEDVRVHSTAANGLINVSHGTCRRVTVSGATERGVVFGVTGSDAVLDSCLATNIFRTWVGYGYIIKQSAGLVKNTVVADVYGPDEAVHISGGTFSNCVVRGMIDNKRDGSSAQNGQSFAAIKIAGSGALVTHSRFVRNGYKNSAREGTAIITAGTMRNCLVADNVVHSYGAVNLSGAGRMENCTVVGNVRNNVSASGLSLHMTGGTAVNNLFSDAESGEASVVVTGGTLATNLVPVALSGSGGTRIGNIVGKPFFIDEANGDYSPGVSSPAVDAADVLSWMAGAEDIRGAARTKGEGPDIGAFEAPYGPGDPLACGITVSHNLFRADAADTAVVFRADVAGAGAATATCAWYLDGAATPDATGRTFTKSDFAPGFHSVQLVVTPEMGPSATASLEKCVFIYPATIYIDSSCATPAEPFATPATAATSFDSAFSWLKSGGEAIPAFGATEADAITVRVRNGSGPYPVHGLYVTQPVRIVADDSCAPILDFQSRTDGIYLQNALAVLDGFTIKNVRAHAVDIYFGAAMRNCSLTGQNQSGYAPIVTLSSGEIDSCSFTNFTGSYAYENYIVKVVNGTVRNTLFSDIRKQFDWMVYVDGSSAVVSNCVIRNSPGKGTEGTDNVRNGILKVVRGLVTHCVVTNSGSIGAGKEGAVALAGGTIRNCLFARNKSYEFGGVKMTGGTLESSTLYGNSVNASTSGSGRDLHQSAGTVLNCIIWNTDGVDGIYTSGGTISGTLSNSTKPGTGNKSFPPNFTDANSDDFTLADNSAARDMGVNQGWMADGTDLAGNPRIVEEVVDAGCYEGAKRAERLMAVLEAGVTGANGDNCLYSISPTVMFGSEILTEYTAVWTINGASAGTTAGPLELELAPLDTPYSISAAVTARGDTVETEVISLFVNPTLYYLDASSANPAFPFSTRATAATKLADILNSIVRDPQDIRVYTVRILPGSHAIPETLVTQPWRFEGTAPDARLTGGPFTLNHDRASVSNIIFHGVQPVLSHGEMRDIVIRNKGGQSGGNLLLISGGLCDGLVVSNCKTTAWNYQTCVAMTGGTLRNFRIADAAGYDKYLHMNGASAIASNGVIRSCTGGLQNSQNNTQHYAIRLEKGLVSHCTVTDNGDLKCVRDGMARVSGGILRNSLFARNLSTDCPGIYLCGGSLESCTVVVADGESLHQTGKGTYGSCLNFTSGRATNCVFFANETFEGGKYYVRKTGGTLAYCWGNPGGVDPAFTGTGVITGTDPHLRTNGIRAFAPSGEPLVGKGVFQPWMAGAVDLVGSPRVIGRLPDMGALEAPAPATQIIMR
jgi:hypothetical protein